MVLGIEDITGGTTILGILIWLGLTGLFYLVCYMATLNISDDLTGNHPIKLLLMGGIAPLSAFLMALFDYNPTLLFVLMAISNFYRVRDISQPGVTRFNGQSAKKTLFYGASYLYIAAVFGLALWFQNPVEAGGIEQPYWKTWFPQEAP